MKSLTESEAAAPSPAAGRLDAVLSRREFLAFSAGAVSMLTALSIGRAWGANAPVIIIDDAKGLLLADSTRCVGCLRCELACTEFNDGRAQPALARIKVQRNLNFGPQGPFAGAPMQGAWGNGQFIQDVCRQCPHPVPCSTACPHDAIKADPQTGARFVDVSACTGCRLCQRACPWNMIGFDEESQKATKCFLCQGQPKCVEACPSGALHYVPWRDLSRDAAPRNTAVQLVPAEKAGSCMECHDNL